MHYSFYSESSLPHVGSGFAVPDWRKKKKSNFAGPSLQPHVCRSLGALLRVCGIAAMPVGSAG